MPEPKRRLPQRVRDADWTELRRRAAIVFVWLQAGWHALSSDERKEVRRLVAKSRGRPRNLTRAEAQRLGSLAGKAASAASGRRRR